MKHAGCRSFTVEQTVRITTSLSAGYSNTGKKPSIALAQIRHLLGYSSTRSDHTDEAMLGITIPEKLYYTMYSCKVKVMLYYKFIIGKSQVIYK